MIDEQTTDALKVEQRIAEVKRGILDQARVDVICDTYGDDIGDDDILDRADRLAEGRARDIVAREMGMLDQ